MTFVDPDRIADLAARVHQNAIDKEFWKTDADGKADFPTRNVGEICMLAISELSEALEVWRDGHATTEIWTTETGKPEGYPIEIADFVIRCIETLKASGADLVSVFKTLQGDILHDKVSIDQPSENLAETLLLAAANITDAHSITVGNPEFRTEAINADNWTFREQVAAAVYLIFQHAEEEEIDLWAAMEQKHEYNKTRPVRHGGKRA